MSFDLASSLTLVGLMRVSIGPAISVIERGCARMLALRHHARRHQRGDARLAHRHHMRARPDHFQKADEMRRCIRRSRSGRAAAETLRALCQSVM